MNGMRGEIVVKTDAEVAKMRAAGRLAADVLDYIAPFIADGADTGRLDALCHEFITARGATPAPLNYAPQGHPPFPKSVCISPNHQVCHGIPDGKRPLRAGDIINIDVTVVKDGWHGDTARMFYVGEVSRKAAHLCEAARECLLRGIAEVRPGAPLSNIGRAIHRHARAQNFSVVADFCGHGLGRAFHEPPQVLHINNDNNEILRPNMVFTIEPMLNAGKEAVKTLPDKWTVVTRDRSLSAQWEHTVRVSEDGCEVLTLSAAERADGEDGGGGDE